LYPFGRKAFRFELDPVLERIQKNKTSTCTVVCSVRDILVEKENQEKHETRAVTTLNNFFDAVLVHSDPEIVKISATFHKYDEILIPVVYTGFIAQKPVASASGQLRRHLHVADDDLLIVASAGGGNVGAPLLEAVIRACKRLKLHRQMQLFVFTGPFLDKERFKGLQQMADESIRIAEFTTDFISLLAAADLSVSMAGYNTSMNILVTKVPALVWPFPQNREQYQRARRLADVGALRVLTENDLQPQQLSEIMDQTLTAKHHPSFEIDLAGAQNTVKWIEKQKGIDRSGFRVQGSGFTKS
jgi:predicted glycosyltransferase